MSQTQTPVLPSDPFGGLKGVVAAKDIPESKYKIAIMGLPKSGKSRFAVTIPGSKVVYDFDDRAQSIRDTPNTVVRSMKDTMTNPFAVSQIEADLSIFKYRKSKGEPIPENFIFDTVSNFVENGIKYAYLKENPKDGRALALGGGLRIQIGISYDRINVVTKFLDYLLTEFSSLGNVIFVFHERDEKDKDKSKKDEIVYTGLVTIEPQFAQNILTFFNEVFRMKVTGSAVANTPAKYEVYCRPTNESIASTTLLVDTIEPPNLADMIEKSRVAKLKQVSK
jgi:hypothetical protein